MTRNSLLILASAFIISCGSSEAGDSEKEDNATAETRSSGKKDKKNSKFGEWETDQQGTKYREDYELKQQLSGYELVKYTRTDGGQYGGSSSTTKFTLCSDGSLKYYYQSLTTISVEGAGGSDAAEDDDYGSWKAIENENGVKILMFKSDKHNNKGYLEIKPMGSKISMVWHDEWQEFLMKKVDC